MKGWLLLFLLLFLFICDRKVIEGATNTPCIKPDTCTGGGSCALDPVNPGKCTGYVTPPTCATVAGDVGTCAVDPANPGFCTGDGPPYPQTPGGRLIRDSCKFFDKVEPGGGTCATIAGDVGSCAIDPANPGLCIGEGPPYPQTPGGRMINDHCKFTEEPACTFVPGCTDVPSVIPDDG